MRKAIYEAEVGDDVFKEDPTVNKLEDYAADLLGKEAALYVPSGMMGNQICLNVLTNPGDEVICEFDAHIFNYESGSPAKLSGIQLMTIKGKLGVMNPEQGEPLIRPKDAYYMPRTKVIEVENTHNRAGGTIWPMEDIIELKNLAKKHDLYYHLDGARIWNASVETGISVKEYDSLTDDEQLIEQITHACDLAADGDFITSVKVLKLALRKMESDTIYYLIARVFIMHDLPDQATRYLQQCLVRNPTNFKALELYTRIQEIVYHDYLFAE